MRRSDDRILTTHVGSLPRTERLLAQLEASEDAFDPDEFHAAADEAVRDAVRRQAEVGIDVGNDGEQARPGFHVYVQDRLSGFGHEVETGPWADLEEFPEYAEEFFYGAGVYSRPAATGPVAYEGTGRVRDELDTFSAALAEEGVAFEERFLTAATPGIVSRTLPNEHYGSESAYLFALAEALRPEYEAIVDSGAVLQLDSPDLLAHGHRSYKDASTGAFRDAARVHVEALNEALSGVPAEDVRLHVCWGNYEGPHHHDTPLAEMLPVIYEADVGGLLVEQASPRHGHEYRAFEEHPLPDDWVLAPGVVDVKTNVLEHPDAIADRIVRFADVVGDPTRILAAPDCGFGSTARQRNVHPTIAWAKLEQLVEGARRATERLF